MTKQNSTESIIDIKIQEILKSEIVNKRELKSRIKRVIVHPLVLLSVVDHFSRITTNSTICRVAGILLGTIRNGVLDVSNSFAVPFDEDDSDASVWFFDHVYLERMYSMTRKINAKEIIVGWYHTGPKCDKTDLEISETIMNYCDDPILLVVDTIPKGACLPSHAFYVRETVRNDGKSTKKSLEYLPCQIDAEEAEEVGVEHLLRDLKTITPYGTLQERIYHQIVGLDGLKNKIDSLVEYLVDVTEYGKEQSYEIIYLLQDVFNLIPTFKPQYFNDALCVRTNDQKMTLYISSMVRTIIALNNLIDNRIYNMENDIKVEKAIVAKKEAAALKAEKEAKKAAAKTTTIEKQND
ncbi:hypothetical protein A3Q56_01299 [Intoshia linei]|uniref:MPN domain-containing protein n=1 Tax=Intoshia linei TaxID=1819745 RepID=A0A177B9Q1_9BILA|nr:hypothetical protein A3Q56_01299 [Intoshia linei]